MNQKQVECFIAVAENLSFTQAGEKLFASQSTISRHINLLEEELGFDLFIRNNKAVRLTPAGLVMMKTFNKMVEIFNNQKKIAYEMNQGNTGKIRIGLVDNMDIDKLWGKIIPRFKNQYPNIALSYECCDFNYLIEKLDAESLDIAIAHTCEQIKGPRYAYDEIVHCKTALVCSKNHPIAKKGFFTGDDLKNETIWTIFTKEFHDNLVRGLLRHYGVTSWHTESVQKFSTALVNVRMGNGILFIDPVTRKLNEEYYYTIPLPDDYFPISISVFWRKANLNPAIPLLLQLLTAED